MPSTPYMKLYIGDYLGDTQHLSCLEHGAYLLLIMAYWQNGGPLENDPKTLRRLTRTDANEWRKCSKNVVKMFKVNDSFLVHARIEKELEKRNQVSTAARDSIKARWNGRNTDVSEKEYGRNTTPIVHIPESIDKDNSFNKREEGILPFSSEYNPSNLSTRIQSMIDEWNSLGAKPPYRKTVLNIPPDKMRDIAATFTSYGDEEIREAIRNYLGVIASADHEAFPAYGTFLGFMASGVEQYCDEADPYARCKTGTKKADDAWRAKAHAILDAEDQDGQA